MNYSDKLKDPRWQKKRLEILQRDSFTCQSCATTTKTLHVHHKYYEKNKDPWEYDEDSLVTLCMDCHEEEQLSAENQMNFLRDFITYSGLLNGQLGDPFPYFLGESVKRIGPRDFEWLVTRVVIDENLLEQFKEFITKARKEWSERPEANNLPF